MRHTLKLLVWVSNGLTVPKSELNLKMISLVIFEVMHVPCIRSVFGYNIQFILYTIYLL